MCLAAPQGGFTMRLDYEIGKIFDTMFAVQLYFNYDIAEKMLIKENYKNPESYFNYFDEIKGKLKPVSEVLYPIFYFTDEKMSPIISFYLNEFDKEDKSLNDLINIINDDSVFKEYIFKYIFNLKSVLSNKCEIYESINKMNVTDKHKLQIYYMTSNYALVKKELIKTLKEIYNLVAKLHDSYQPQINTGYRILSKEELVEIHAKLLDCEVRQLKRSVSGFSLLNKYFIDFHRGFETIQLMFGVNYMEPFLRSMTYKTVSYESFFRSFSNPIKLDVIKALYKHGELTAIELTGLVQGSYSNVIRYIRELSDQSIIVVSRHQAVKIYYSINKEYFVMIRKIVDNFMEQMSNDNPNIMEIPDIEMPDIE